MKNVNDRIIDVAIELAEEAGFASMRQRDLAKRAGVALGTLYKHFRNKEDIFAAAVARQAELLESWLALNPVSGPTPHARLTQLTAICTRGMVVKPHYARAVLRAVASGVPETAQSVTSYYRRIRRLIVVALRGRDDDAPATATEEMLAMQIQQLWFASMVGWSAGLHDIETVLAQVDEAAGLLLRATGYAPDAPGAHAGAAHDPTAAS